MAAGAVNVSNLPSSADTRGSGPEDGFDRLSCKSTKSLTKLSPVGDTSVIPRLTYEHSCRRLRELGYLGSDENPTIPDDLPLTDDPHPLGISFFRTLVGDGDDLSSLTLPRTFFGRSEISNVKFCNTDLSESNLCWNDFIDVDFTDAVLARSDLRCSIFRRVNFTRCDLRGADLRATFHDCLFDDALLDGAVMGRWQRWKIGLSRAQRRVMTSRGALGIPNGG